MPTIDELNAMTALVYGDAMRFKTITSGMRQEIISLCISGKKVEALADIQHNIAAIAKVMWDA